MGKIALAASAARRAPSIRDSTPSLGEAVERGEPDPDPGKNRGAGQKPQGGSPAESPHVNPARPTGQIDDGKRKVRHPQSQQVEGSFFLRCRLRALRNFS